MIKKIILAVVILILNAGVVAGNVKNGNSSWITPFRLCFSNGGFSLPQNVNVYGLNFGFPESYNDLNQKIYGLDVGLVIAKAEVTGLQATLMNYSKKSTGLQVSLVNKNKSFDGLQLGIVNGTEYSHLCQFGIVNFYYDYTKGVQISAVNFAEKSNTCQIGIVNIGDDMTSGLQFGLINYMPNGFLPFFPFFNFSIL